MEPILIAEKITKTFAGVQTLKNIDLKVNRGEIHCLVGENGCGKSTLIKCISGVYTQDSGYIILNNNRYLFDYDYTILEFGGNDCDFDWNSVSESPFDAHRPNITMDIFRNTYKSMIESVIAAGSTPILLTLPPLDSNRFFSWISKGLDGGNIMSFLNNDVETIYNWHKIYNDMVRRLAAEYGIALIDIRKAFTDKKEYSDFLCADGMHPNANGHKFIAACVGNAVRGLAS